MTARCRAFTELGPFAGNFKEDDDGDDDRDEDGEEEDEEETRRTRTS